MFDIRRPMSLLWTAAALVLVLLVPGAKAVNALQTKPAPTTQYVVRSGDTLWGIAREAGMGGDRRAAVDRILEMNDLGSASLRPGQILLLPSR